MHAIVKIGNLVGAYCNTPIQHKERSNTSIPVQYKSNASIPIQGNEHCNAFIQNNKHCNAPIQHNEPGNAHDIRFESPSKNLGAIIRGYKSAVTKQINELRDMLGVPIWQRNYYEHIIRSERAYKTIYRYIINNPQKWMADKFLVP